MLEAIVVRDGDDFVPAGLLDSEAQVSVEAPCCQCSECRWHSLHQQLQNQAQSPATAVQLVIGYGVYQEHAAVRVVLLVESFFAIDEDTLEELVDAIVNFIVGLVALESDRLVDEG